MSREDEPYLILFGQPTENRIVFHNGDGSEAIIPADLLPESQRDGRAMIDAVEAVKHLVELIRKHEAEQKDLWQFMRGKTLAEAERLAALCRSTNEQCPRIESECPFIGLSCGQIQPEHWLEILRKEAEQE